MGLALKLPSEMAGTLCMLTDVPRRLIENGTISGGAAGGFVLCKMYFTLSAGPSGRAV